MIQANAMTHEEYMEMLNEIDDYFEAEEDMESSNISGSHYEPAPIHVGRLDWSCNDGQG